jgi:predicted alpha/beta hydrolase family esterase
MERVFIIHGWTTTNKQDWIPWAVKAISDKGYSVTAPLMPNTNYPLMSVWQQKMEAVVGKTKPTDIFIGHSLGCQAILRFLASQSNDTKVNKILLVAGAQKLSKEALPLPEDEKIFGPWRDKPINFTKVRKMANQIIAIFSDDDPWVLLEENAPIYEKELGATIIVEKGKKHFMKDNGGITELPILLQYI